MLFRLAASQGYLWVLAEGNEIPMEAGQIVSSIGLEGNTKQLRSF
jgi:hypothetical protein